MVNISCYEGGILRRCIRRGVTIRVYLHHVEKQCPPHDLNISLSMGSSELRQASVSLLLQAAFAFQSWLGTEKCKSCSVTFCDTMSDPARGAKCIPPSGYHLMLWRRYSDDANGSVSLFVCICIVKTQSPTWLGLGHKFLYGQLRIMPSIRLFAVPSSVPLPILVGHGKAQEPAR